MLGLGNSNIVLSAVLIIAITTALNVNLNGVSASEFEGSNGYPKALKGAYNACDREPCRNSGVCIQVSQAPKYRCQCVGTGYWGSNCQRKCPDIHENQMIAHYPHECVVI